MERTGAINCPASVRRIGHQRRVLDGILWKMTTRCPWEDIPARYGSWQSCVHYYRCWKKERRLRRIVQALLKDVRQRGGFDIEQACRIGFVQLIQHGRRWQVYFPATFPVTWQLSTSLLFYQQLAIKFEEKSGFSHRTEPLHELFNAGQTSGAFVSIAPAEGKEL